MRKRYRVFAAVSAVAMLSVVGGTPRAQASDDKVFPATLCRVLTTGSAAYFGDNRLFNTGTTTMDVLCPIVRDTTLSPWSTIEVVAVDRHLTANVQCWAQSQNREGTAIFFSATHSTTTGREGLTGQVLSLPWSASLAEFDRGAFSIRCLVPSPDPSGPTTQRSGLVNYFIAEP